MSPPKHSSSRGPLIALVGDVDSFAASVWGRHAHRSVGDVALLDLLSIDAVDSLLADGLRRPHFRVLRDGVTLPASDVSRRVRTGGTTVDDFADAERITDQIAQGATLVLQGLEHIRREVAEFADELAIELGHRVQANAYLSPPRSAGLVPHTDSHDVFAVQLFGVKMWTVEGLDEATTSVGDVLYIPAGVRHYARTDDNWSLHLTIGVHAISVGAALRRAVQRIVTAETAMARPLPIAFAGTARDLAIAQLSEARDDLVALLTRLDLGAVVDAESVPIRRCAASGSRLGSSGRVASLVSSTQLTVDSLVVATAGTTVNSADPQSIRITGGRRALTLPARVRPAVDHLLSGRSCRVGEVPELDEASRLVLVRRLAAEGVVVMTK